MFEVDLRQENWSRLGVKLFHETVDNFVGLLGFSKTLANHLEAFLLIWLVLFTCGVLLVSIVLNLLTFILDLCETQRCGRPFKEVTKA